MLGQGQQPQIREIAQNIDPYWREMQTRVAPQLQGLQPGQRLQRHWNAIKLVVGEIEQSEMRQASRPGVVQMGVGESHALQAQLS